jgi:predicted ATPase with chaperone activity
MDRIDLHIEVPAVKFDELADVRKGESSEQVRKRVIAAREVQAVTIKRIPRHLLQRATQSATHGKVLHHFRRRVNSF